MTALIKYETARAALAEARTLDEVKDIRDKAEAIRAYARMAKDQQLEIDATEIRVRAMRRIGEMMEDGKDERAGHGGDRKSKDSEKPLKPTLAEAGIDKNLAHQARQLAAMTEEEFEHSLTAWRAHVSAESKRVTVNLLKEGRQSQRKAGYEQRVSNGCTADDLETLIRAGKKFRAILADPPWHFVARSEKGEGRSASQHYITDREQAEQIKALPIRELTAADCVLFMWMVDWAPQLALDVIDAWGFAHKTAAFTWAKQNQSGDGWFMGNGSEACWLATRGHPKRLNADVRQLVIARVTEHSRKPDEIHDRIERLVAGPYLELFARRERANWVTWGNELEFKLPPHDRETEETTKSAEAMTAPRISPLEAIAFATEQITAAHDGLDLPSFLRIGHPECWRKDK
jgi:N6-adenosine-specific RNA methylase IME4